MTEGSKKDCRGKQDTHDAPHPPHRHPAHAGSGHGRTRPARAAEAAAAERISRDGALSCGLALDARARGARRAARRSRRTGPTRVRHRWPAVTFRIQVPRRDGLPSSVSPAKSAPGGCAGRRNPCRTAPSPSPTSARSPGSTIRLPSQPARIERLKAGLEGHSLVHACHLHAGCRRSASS